MSVESSPRLPAPIGLQLHNRKKPSPRLQPQRENREPNTGEYFMEIAAKLAGIAITIVIIAAAAHLTLVGA